MYAGWIGRGGCCSCCCCWRFCWAHDTHLYLFMFDAVVTCTSVLSVIFPTLLTLLMHCTYSVCKWLLMRGATTGPLECFCLANVHIHTFAWNNGIISRFAVQCSGSRGWISCLRGVYVCVCCSNDGHHELTITSDSDLCIWTLVADLTSHTNGSGRMKQTHAREGFVSDDGDGGRFWWLLWWWWFWERITHTEFTQRK